MVITDRAMTMMDTIAMVTMLMVTVAMATTWRDLIETICQMILAGTMRMGWM